MSKDASEWPPESPPADDAAELARVHEVAERGPYKPAWESLRSYRVPLWYQDGKLGIFVHWGVFSVPAFGSEWYSRAMYLEGTPEFEHHVRRYGPQREAGYKDFIPEFGMEDFDPADWAALFHRAGAQFVVPVAEHHDGFAMYDTRRSRWSAAKMGPGRDVFGQLHDAVERSWMVSGASSHRAEHWFFMNGGTRFDSDVRDPRFADFYGPAQREELAPNERFLEDWLLRCVEVIDNYRPQVLYFDWWIESPAFEPYLRLLAAYYYNRAAEWGREVVINFKWDAFAPGTAVYDIERGAMGGTRPDVWQNDTSLSRTSWSWVGDQHQYKSPQDVVAELADTVSKNGVLLLNVGPKPDGTIPDEERRLLEKLGAWLSRNGEAIYGTRPWLIPSEGPTHRAAGSFVDATSPSYTASDLRFTTRAHVTGDYLYAIVLGDAADTVHVRSFGAGSGLLTREIQELTVLGSREAPRWTLSERELTVALPKSASRTQPVIKLFLAPEAVPPRQDFLHG